MSGWGWGWHRPRVRRSRRQQPRGPSCRTGTAPLTCCRAHASRRRRAPDASACRPCPRCPSRCPRSACRPTPLRSSGEGGRSRIAGDDGERHVGRVPARSAVGESAALRAAPGGEEGAGHQGGREQRHERHTEPAGAPRRGSRPGRTEAHEAGRPRGLGGGPVQNRDHRRPRAFPPPLLPRHRRRPVTAAYSPSWRSAPSTVWARSTAMVMGPTPPGTGVMRRRARRPTRSRRRRRCPGCNRRR